MTLIRAERPTDIPFIHIVNARAFGTPAEAELVDALRKSAAFIPELSLVADLGGQVVGHIMFTHVGIRSEATVTPGLSLAPVAVLPDFQRLGIGTRLVREGLAAARSLGHRLVVAVGHPAFYLQFGFVRAGERGLRAPFPVPDEAFLVCEIEPGALAGVEGTVIYPAAFDEACSG